MTERSADSILGALEELHADTGCVPTRSDVIYYDDELLGEIGPEFGTLERTIEASSIDQEKIFIQDIQNVADEVGHAPTKSEFKRHGDHDLDQLVSHFGPWSNALETAEVTEEPVNEDDSQKQEYLAEISRLHEEADVVVSGKQMDLEGAYSVYELSREFGSWDAAIEAAGIDKGEALEDEIRRVARELDRVPDRTDMDDRGRVSAGMCAQFFGSWSEALEQALEESSDTRDERTTHASDYAPRSDLLEDLERVKRIVHREPTKDEYIRLGNYGIDAVEDRFGNWGSFLGTAGTDRTSPDQLAAETTWQDIPDNARLDDPIPVKVLDVDRNPGPRKSTVLAVTEASGRELPVNIWEKHPGPVQWEVGESYLLHNMRGTVWKKGGSTRKLLDSTRDIEVERLNESPSDWDEDSTEDESEPQVDESEKISSLMDDLDDLL